ncbi:hypothetical protein AB0N14_01880 [Streptomyces sp. NPDC051104]|uniref:hypothetical protein n=1 Tax=Streptomyces sp. NPDC051104 TaxID=3155044 RepID=UPI003426A6F1
MLHITSLIAVYVVVVLQAVAGILVLTTGRVGPWARTELPRPRLWDFGALCFAAGLGLCRYGSTVRDLTVLDVVSAIGLALMMSGAVLQFRARHVGRAPV